MDLLNLPEKVENLAVKFEPIFEQRMDAITDRIFFQKRTENWKNSWHLGAQKAKFKHSDKRFPQAWDSEHRISRPFQTNTHSWSEKGEKVKALNQNAKKADKL